MSNRLPAPRGAPTRGVGWISQRPNDRHPAWDIACRVGTPLYSILGGVVHYIGAAGSMGMCVVIRSGDRFIAYGHMSLPSGVLKRGDQVAADQFIGLSGNTGTSTGPHVHVEGTIGGALRPGRYPHWDPFVGTQTSGPSAPAPSRSRSASRSAPSRARARRTSRKKARAR